MNVLLKFFYLPGLNFLPYFTCEKREKYPATLRLFNDYTDRRLTPRLDMYRLYRIRYYVDHLIRLSK